MENEEKQNEGTQVETPNVEVKSLNGVTTAEVLPNPDPLETPEETTETPTEETEQQQADNSQTTQEELESDIQKQQKAEQDIKDNLAAKGVDFDAVSKEYETTGALSPETLSKLEEAGYPKSVVDAYLNGIDAMTERFVSKVKDMAGGEEGYNNLASFLRSQPQSTIDAFNASIQTGNLNQIQLAIDGIKAQMVRTYGTANPTVMTGAQGAGEPQGYTNVSQMTKDMADPRYQTDPAFTREVARKVANATFF